MSKDTNMSDKPKKIKLSPTLLSALKDVQTGKMSAFGRDIWIMGYDTPKGRSYKKSTIKALHDRGLTVRYSTDPVRLTEEGQDYLASLEESQAPEEPIA